MSSHVARRRSSWRELFSVRLRAVLALCVVLCVGVTGSFAYWSDSVTVAGTTFTSGTIDLKVDGQDAVTGYTALKITNMVPGNSTAGVLTVRNDGTAPFTYSLAAAGTNTDSKDLIGALTAKVTGDTSTTGAAPAVKCGGTALANTGTTLGANLISSPSPRLLAPKTEEIICIQATLPTNASTTLQGATTDVTFTFTANQLS